MEMLCLIEIVSVVFKENTAEWKVSKGFFIMGHLFRLIYEGNIFAHIIIDPLLILKRK